MSQIVSQTKWFINSPSQGNKQLRYLTDYSDGDESSIEAVNEVGSDFPVGTRRKPGAIPIEFTSNQPVGTTPEVDWNSLQDSSEVFSLTKQLVGGRRMQFLNCQVSTITGDGDADGSHTMKVSIISLQRKVLR